MILVLGESIIDIVDSVESDSNSYVGGSPLNVAVTLARLRTQSKLLSTLGDDANGDRVRSYLDDNKVDFSEIGSGCGRTNTATARLDVSGNATYDFQLIWDPNEVHIDRDTVRALHTGSLATAIEPGALLVTETLKREREHLTLTYDPNIRPSLMGDHPTARQNVEEIVSIADVVKASDEDLRWLYPGQEFEAVAMDWIGRGPAVVIITLGDVGAFAATRHCTLRLEALPVKVIDTVGAGDSFMGSVLCTLSSLDLLGGDRRQELRSLDENRLRLLVQHALEVAALTVSRAGADPPLLSELSFGEWLPTRQ